MKKLIAALMILALGYFVLTAYASTCFLSGSRVSGLNRICYYECVSGTAAITISSVELCPLSISD